MTRPETVAPLGAAGLVRVDVPDGRGSAPRPGVLARLGGTLEAGPTGFANWAVSDDELATLALSCDPDTVVPDDAVSVWDLIEQNPGPLPNWYMPPVAAGPRSYQPWRRRVAVLIICAFVVIDAYGLCSTYGWPVVA